MNAKTRAAEKAIRPARSIIGASVYSLPGDTFFFIHLVDRRSRAQWKAMPLDALPPIGTGPVLVFGEFGETATWSSRNPVTLKEETRHSSIELRRIVDDHQQYNRISIPHADRHDHRAISARKQAVLERAKLAKRMRARWVDLVDHAIGYASPDDPLAILEFRD